jgi:hypothetical protein
LETSSTIDSTSDFRSSPLITPERLKRDHKEALHLAPPWASIHEIAHNEDELEHSKAVVRIDGEHPGIEHILALSLAFLFELTRFGHSVARNINGKADDPKALVFVKVTYRGAEYDDTTMGRLIVDAPPGKIVARLDVKDHHPDLLVVRGGSAKKATRAIAMKHAERLAREVGASEVEIAAYLSNLRALLALHDELLGISLSDD